MKALKNGSETHQKGGEQTGKVKVPGKSQKGFTTAEVTKKGTVKPCSGK